MHGSFDEDGNVHPHCTWIYYADVDGKTRKHKPRQGGFQAKKEFVDPFYRDDPPKIFN